jgi:hypothetical protein
MFSSGGIWVRLTASKMSRPASQGRYRAGLNPRRAWIGPMSSERSGKGSIGLLGRMRTSFRWGRSGAQGG